MLRGGNVGVTESGLERQVRELAALDWANMPTEEVRRRFRNVTVATLSVWRRRPEYKETINRLRRCWMDEIARLPKTAELRDRINQAMCLSIDKLVHILVKKGTEDKDIISTARLVAQMDGRFLGATEDQPGKLNPQIETLADALLTELKKTNETIQ